MKDKDLCITMGGDNTFLRAAGQLVEGGKTTIVGFNTSPTL